MTLPTANTLPLVFRSTSSTSYPKWFSSGAVRVSPTLSKPVNQKAMILFIYASVVVEAA